MTQTSPTSTMAALGPRANPDSKYSYSYVVPFSSYLTLSHRDLEVRYWSTQYRRVTDGQTDGQTSCHGIVRARHTRRVAKKSFAKRQLTNCGDVHNKLSDI